MKPTKKAKSLDEELDEVEKELGETDQFLTQQSVRVQDIQQSRARIKKL